MKNNKIWVSLLGKISSFMASGASYPYSNYLLFCRIRLRQQFNNKICEEPWKCYGISTNFKVFGKILWSFPRRPSRQFPRISLKDEVIVLEVEVGELFVLKSQWNSIPPKRISVLQSVPMWSRIKGRRVDYWPVFIWWSHLW